MRLGIMQPYFAPALGYFDLIALSDQWVVFDTAQYRKKSWMNRNRILHPNKGWQYITAPVAKHSRDAPIKDIRLKRTGEWRQFVVNQFGHYRDAPHYERTIALIESCLSEPTESLCELSVLVMRRVCELLELQFSPVTFSSMEVELGPIRGPGDWALRISEALGATEYINPPGGESLFDRDEFERAGITLSIRRFTDLEYPVGRFTYEPSLSVFDVLMWCSLDVILAHLDGERARFLELRQ